MARSITKTIGSTARKSRKALELTQEDAAERIGISSEFYARIERGSSMPSITTLIRIAQTYQISADMLLGRVPFEEPTRPSPSSRDNPELRRLLRMLKRAAAPSREVVLNFAKALEAHLKRSRAENDSDATDDPDTSDS